MIGYVKAYKNCDLVVSGRRFTLARRYADCTRSLKAAGRDEGWLRRQALSAGLRSLPRKRRVGLDPWRKCWTEHRILVDLLADTPGKRMVTLGYGCSRIRVERS